MPGRQSTGPSPRLKPRGPQRRKRKRGLDAFAIADQETQRSAKVRPSRLGHLENGGSPETDNYSGDEDGDEESAHHPKRSRREGDSDEGGNGWATGDIASEDDSSIDSDEAMGSGDEERFAGFTFRGGSSKKAAKDARGASDDFAADIDLKEDEPSDQSDAESEEFNAAAIDPAAILDQRDSESESESEETQGDGMPTHRFPASLETRDMDEDVDDVSQLSFSAEEEDNEAATEGLSGLRSFVDGLDDGTKTSNAGKSAAEVHEGMVPTDFGITSKKKLSIGDMLQTVTDPKARKSLRSLTTESKPAGRASGVPQKLSVPLPKRQQDRVDRAVAYDKSKDTLERWVETVKRNRRAEHLEFPLPDPEAAAAKSNAHLPPEPSVKPVTALESTIQRIMEESGMDTKQGKSQDGQIQEFEELAANKMPLEEVRARRAQLRKTRELLFREEIKAKRIKKIKSKSWRKVHRKERERNALREKEMLAEAGIEPDEDEIEQSHRQRAEERMGGRHRASRWAKGVKKIGRAAWDDETRAGIHEMARREEELRKRMQGQDVDSSSGTESGSESDDEASSDETDEGRGSRRLLDKLDRLQRPNESTSGLHSLKFMQKAEAARKAQNDEDIERLRRELAGEESPTETDEETEPLGRRKFGPDAVNKSNDELQPTMRTEFEEHEEADGADVEFSGRNASASAYKEPSIRNGKPDPPSTKPRPSEHTQIQMQSGATDQTNSNPWMTVTKKSRSKHGANPAAGVQISTTAEPPSTLQLSHPSTSQSSQTKSRPAPSSQVDLEAVPTESHSASDSDSESDSEPTTPALSNQALIRQAFAADDVLSAEFAAEKAALAAEEAAGSADDDPADQQLPGWGSWVGEGVSKRKTKAKSISKQASATTVAQGKEQGKPKGDQRVIISGKTQKPHAAYLATQLPHPFETKAQYERSLRLPVGPEWQTHAAFKAGTKPRVKVRAGEVIRPMRKPLM